MDHICHCINGQVNAWVKRPGHFTSTIVRFLNEYNNNIPLLVLVVSTVCMFVFKDAFSKIVRNEGVFSLWSGLPPTLIMAVPATIIYFVSYEELRVFFNDTYTKATGVVDQPFAIPLFAGGLARLWAVTVVSPMELIRTKMQSKRLSYRGRSKESYDNNNYYC